METLQMIQVTPEELKTMIVEGVKEVLEGIIAYMQPANDQELYTKKEATAKLKISLSTLNNWIKSGKLPASGIGNRVYIKSEDLQTALIEKSVATW